MTEACGERQPTRAADAPRRTAVPGAEFGSPRLGSAGLMRSACKLTGPLADGGFSSNGLPGSIERMADLGATDRARAVSRPIVLQAVTPRQDAR